MPEGESLRDLDSLILSMRLLIRFELDGRGAASQGLGWSARVKDLRSWKCTLIFLSSREASSSVASFMYSVILRGLLALHLPADKNWSRHDELGEQLRSGCLSLRASLNCWYSLTEQPSGMAEGEWLALSRREASDDRRFSSEAATDTFSCSSASPSSTRVRTRLFWRVRKSVLGRE